MNMMILLIGVGVVVLFVAVMAIGAYVNRQ